MTASAPAMLPLWSGPMTISAGIDMAISSPLGGWPAVWQPDCAWRNQHERSQTEAEIDIEIRKRGKVTAANRFATKRILQLYSKASK
jgi:hypothetical protein